MDRRGAVQRLRPIEGAPGPGRRERRDCEHARLGGSGDQHPGPPGRRRNGWRGRGRRRSRRGRRCWRDDRWCWSRRRWRDDRWGWSRRRRRDDRWWRSGWQRGRDWRSGWHRRRHTGLSPHAHYRTAVCRRIRLQERRPVPRLFGSVLAPRRRALPLPVRLDRLLVVLRQAPRSCRRLLLRSAARLRPRPVAVRGRHLPDAPTLLGVTVSLARRTRAAPARWP